MTQKDYVSRARALAGGLLIGPCPAGCPKRDRVSCLNILPFPTMSKPPMTQADVDAITKALEEKHSAESALQRACLEQRSNEEIDQAIRKFQQASEAYRSLGAKFFENWKG